MSYNHPINPKAPIQGGHANLSNWIALAREGIETFPAGPDKKPLLKSWQTKATADTDTIRAWLDRWPDAMPAMPTGDRNSLSVLDLDVRDDGRDGISAATDLGVQMSRAFTVRTPSGGLHLYYRHRDGLTNASNHLPDGIDVRGQGGYVIAPGAVLPDGRAYRIKRGCDLADLELSPCFPAKLMPTAREERQADLQDCEHDLTASNVRDLLAFLEADPIWRDHRDGWLRVGIALHDWSGGSDEGRELWTWFSRESPHFNRRELIKDWKSFGGKAGGVTLGTLIAAAPEWSEARHAVTADDFEDDPHGDDDRAEPVAAQPFFHPASSWTGQPIPEREWVVPDMIPNGQVTLLSGDGGVGKSLLALQLAVSVATGSNWIGQPVDKPGKVLVLGAEDDDSEMHRRVASICKAQRVEMADLGNLMVRSLAGEDALLATPSQSTGRLTATAFYKRLTEIIGAMKPRLVVLDTLADLFGGNENDRAQARQFVGMLRAWSIKHYLAVVLLAHPSRAGMATGSGDSGSTAWHGSVRSRMYLDTVKVDGQEADTSARVLKTMKANYGPRGGDLRLIWRDGCFSTDDGFDAAERDEWAEEIFLDCLDARTAQGRNVSPNRSVSFAPTVFAKLPTACGLSKREFESAMERLLSRGMIVIREHGPASTRRVHLERAVK